MTQKVKIFSNMVYNILKSYNIRFFVTIYGLILDFFVPSVWGDIDVSWFDRQHHIEFGLIYTIV